ncbi:MAG: restriction endonuclease subunit S [Gammaproteobacteria bacterium]|nr:restriction endonuclease subunit S [Gammaproteobacteria bacterium]
MFNEVGSVTVGGTPSTSVPEYWGGAIPWMVSGDVHSGVINDVPTRISGLGLRNSSAMMVDPPSVAVALAGQGRTRGTAAYIRCALCTNQSVALLKGDPDELDTEYLLHNLSFRYSELRSRSAGGGRAGLTKTILEQLPLPLPAISEQSKIAEVLSAVDRAIEQTEALIAKQQRIRTGLMQDLLTRGIDEHGNLRSEQTHKFKDSPLGRIPVEWDVTKIGDQFVERKERGLTGLPVMSIVMNVGLVERSLVDRRVETNLTPEQHALVCEGDIAYNMMRMWQGVLGRASFDCLVSPAYVVLRPLESTDSRFVQWLFTDLRMIHAFCKASKGVVDDRLRLYPKDIFPILMAIPKCLDEHTLIADRLDAQHKAIESSISGLEKLQLLKRGLMQDLLTGNRRVTALLKPKDVT